MSVPRALISNGCNLKSFLLPQGRVPCAFVKTQIAGAQLQPRGLFSSSILCSSSDKLSQDNETKKSDGEKDLSRSKITEETPDPPPVIAISTDPHLLGRKQVAVARRARVIPHESEGEDEAKRDLDISKIPKPNIAPPTVVLITRSQDVNHLRPMYIPPKDDEITEEDLIPPTNCCMSGCSNCVWIDYVEKMTKFYSNPQMGKDRVHRDVESIDDPNIKAWLIMDLKFKRLW